MEHHQNLDRRTLLKAAASLAFPLPGFAAAQPTTPIRIYQGFGIASVPDQIGRLLAVSLSERFGRPFLVENKPGAAERMLAAFIAQLPPDGQNLYLMTGVQAVHAALDKSIRYNVRRDFTLLSTLIAYPFVLCVGEGSKYRSLSDLIEAARSNPGKLSYSTTGVGSTPHLAAEMVWHRAGVKVTHVPYPSADMGKYYADVATGRLDMAMGGVKSAGALAQGGKLRLLAVTGPERLPILPDVPSVNEFAPGSDVSTWVGLAGPAGIAPALRDPLIAAARSAVEQPAFKAEAYRNGYTRLGGTPEQFRQLLESDIAKFSKLAHDAGIVLAS